MYRYLLSISFVLMGTVGFHGIAYGQSCIQLAVMMNQSQFYAAPASSITRYHKAIKKQRKFLVQVNSDIKRYRCHLLNHSNACTQLRHSQQQMEANLSHLKQELAGIKSRPTAISKQNINTKMADRSCQSASFVSLKRAPNHNERVNEIKLKTDLNTKLGTLKSAPQGRATGQNWTNITKQAAHKPQNAFGDQPIPAPIYRLEDLRISQTLETPSVTNISIKPDMMIEHQDEHTNLMPASERQVRKVGPTFLPEREFFFE